MIRSLFAILFIIIWTEGVLAKPSSDFDGDGVTDFDDFVLFAGKVGSAQGEPGFDSRFDLDSNGKVDFGDFTLFAETFGRGEVASKQALKADELERIAKELQENDKPTEAITKYVELLKVAPEDRQKALALSQLGELYIKTNQLAKAETYFDKGINDFDKDMNRRVRYQVMWCYMGLGELELLRGNIENASLYWEMSKKFAPPPLSR